MFFPSELPHGLPPKRNIDHDIDLLPRVAPINISLYQSRGSLYSSILHMRIKV